MILTAKMTGDFPGSPISARFQFVLDEGKNRKAKHQSTGYSRTRFWRRTPASRQGFEGQKLESIGALRSCKFSTVAEFEFSAIRLDDSGDSHGTRSVFGRIPGNRNFLLIFERSCGPASWSQIAGT
jgi:hypothetical protein